MNSVAGGKKYKPESDQESRPHCELKGNIRNMLNTVAMQAAKFRPWKLPDR